MSIQTPRRGFPFLHWAWLGLLVLLAGCAALAPEPERERHRQAGLAIQAVYEAALPELPPNKQRHYAQRLYRITGDDRYLELNREYGQRLLQQLDEEIAGLADPGHAAERSREIVEAYSQRTAKQRARRKMLADWGEIAFAKQLLFRLVQAEYHGLLPEIENLERAREYLAGVDWRPFFVDPEVMRIYAAQVANQVMFLHQLGIADLRREVVEAFRRQYPAGSTRQLSEQEYRNKLYGMTHFVIAASRYYQQRVDAEEFAWVLEAFERDIEGILARATEDIQAEVALSFLLAGREEHPVVNRVSDALVAAIDPAAGMIPSPSGSTDLARGEHRNVLAIMVLRWPETLYAGPHLSVSGSLHEQVMRLSPRIAAGEAWRPRVEEKAAALCVDKVASTLHASPFRPAAGRCRRPPSGHGSRSGRRPAGSSTLIS
ncbi:DUF3541 domain-containing protein [Halomonas sp. LBP4]|uniref:DUF3541 domain-containing protein n=1 Tax=Halomonas sp. LBP4 TaxID=2044917 RepID=UPI0021AD485E|nr:DUF3541 domain-containing protein [Halomonas sp. LBP4]